MNSVYVNSYKQLENASLIPATVALPENSSSSYTLVFPGYGNIALFNYRDSARYLNAVQFPVIVRFNEVNIVASSGSNNPQAMGAPLWLKERMKALRAMPPPTFDRMKTQLKASAEAREKSNDRESS